MIFEITINLVSLALSQGLYLLVVEKHQVNNARRRPTDTAKSSILDKFQFRALHCMTWVGECPKIIKSRAASKGPKPGLALPLSLGIARKQPLVSG